MPVVINKWDSRIDKFTAAYIVAMLWAETDDAGQPLDRNYSADDLAPETVAAIEEDCKKFQADNAELLSAAYAAYGGRNASTPEELAGHDFWLTRVGHGAGFWDGDWDGEEGDFGDKLTEACKKFKHVDPYVGDDGKIYVS